MNLNKELDLVRKEVFLGKNASFLGSLLCSVEFRWDHERDYVGTDGIHLTWGVPDFKRCTQPERVSTLIHELWHVALMHMARRGDRDPRLWNIACDYRINNDLRKDGYHIPDNWIVDPSIDANGILAEEQIYDLLLQNSIPIPPDYKPDMEPGDSSTNEFVKKTQQVAEAVTRAVQAAEMDKQAGILPGVIKKYLDQFLAPVVRWETHLMQWMTDKLTEDFSWRRRNRRYQNIYMPSRVTDEGRLTHLVYFQDTSGSISEAEIIRFNSELKYIQEVLNPEKLTIVQFDHEIQYERSFSADEPFEGLEINGGGGTLLEPVREWIEKNQPTAVVVFSDLWCSQMEPLKSQTPILWAVVNNPSVEVPFGTKINIEV